ncbi:MAG: helix-turn-helix transcriptional regulator [Bacteroidaceae bacterium]|nr:helix-turn-helix transcriptional regulator [Bacteroidaceae bacterium]
MAYKDNFLFMTLNVGFAEHNADWNWRGVRSPFARLYYVTEGEADIELLADEGTTIKETLHLSPGNLYFVPPFVTHNNVCRGHFSHYYIHIYEHPDAEHYIFSEYDFPHQLPATAQELNLMQQLAAINPQMRLRASNPKSYDNQTELLNSVRQNQNRPQADILASRGIIYVLISRFLREAQLRPVASDERIVQVIHHIRTHLHEPLHVAALAKEVLMSKDHLIRLFKRNMGITPSAYILQRRMELAELLLITTPMPIKAVASRTGFEDYSYFCRVFRRELGTTPHRYRRA